jgi:DNA-binding transcriptional ArsR family regulator
MNKQINIPACSDDSQVNAAVSIMDLSSYTRQNKPSRKVLADILADMRKRRKVHMALDKYADMLGITESYLRIAMIALREFGLVSRDRKGRDYIYRVNERQLKNPSVKPLEILRTPKATKAKPCPEREPEPVRVTASGDVKPRTRCYECGCKPTKWVGKLCLLCDAIKRKEVSR